MSENKPDIDPAMKMLLEGSRPWALQKEMNYWLPDSTPIEQSSHISVVGACAKCGAPIYGRPVLSPGEDPQVSFLCSCPR